LNSQPAQIWNYAYGQPCYGQYGSNWPDSGGNNCAPPGTDAANGALVGHDWTRVELTDAAGAGQQVVKHDFESVNGYLRGREAQTIQYEADGVTEVSRVDNVWGYNDAVCQVGTLPSTVTFVCLKQATTTITDPANNATLSTREAYYYNTSNQDGDQYGLRTHTYVFDENDVRQRINFTGYVANTNTWVIVPKTQATFDGGWKLAAATHNLYDGNIDIANPTVITGDLTLTRQRLDEPGSNCVDPTTHKTVDASFEYDPIYGNLITTTTYAGYGWISCQNNSYTNQSNPGDNSLGISSRVAYDNHGLFPKSSFNGLDYETATVSYNYWDDPTLAGGLTFFSPLMIEMSAKDGQNIRQFYDGAGPGGSNPGRWLANRWVGQARCDCRHQI